jgi:hypothetical protein
VIAVLALILSTGVAHAGGFRPPHAREKVLRLVNRYRAERGSSSVYGATHGHVASSMDELLSVKETMSNRSIGRCITRIRTAMVDGIIRTL